MSRYAAIDIGTNSVLLLVADRKQDGRFVAIEEHAEITRLGRGVDSTRRLEDDSMDATVLAVERFAQEARELGAQGIAVSATSAARDATNGPQFLEQVQARAQVQVELLSGDEEAQLSFAAVRADFPEPRPLVVLDIGGGSTEFIYGDVHGHIVFRHSFDVGSVRQTERIAFEDPPSSSELLRLEQSLADTFASLPEPPPQFRLVGVAGTVTTLCAVARRIEPYQAQLVQGTVLSADEVEETSSRLASLPLALRKTLPGLQPKRADVIVAGAMIARAAMKRLHATELTVSDRGLRWGLLAKRFGGHS